MPLRTKAWQCGTRKPASKMKSLQFMNHIHTFTSNTQYYTQFAQAKQFNSKLFCNCTGTRLFVSVFFISLSLSLLFFSFLQKCYYFPTSCYITVIIAVTVTVFSTEQRPPSKQLIWTSVINHHLCFFLSIVLGFLFFFSIFVVVSIRWIFLLIECMRMFW